MNLETLADAWALSYVFSVWLALCVFSFYAVRDEWRKGAIWARFWLVFAPITLPCLAVYAVGMLVKNMPRAYGLDIVRGALFAVLVVPFLVVDVLYNLIVATFIFMSPPRLRWNWRGSWLEFFGGLREVMLTYVLKRRVTVLDHRHGVATFKARLLNFWDRGHV